MGTERKKKVSASGDKSLMEKLSPKPVSLKYSACSTLYRDISHLVCNTEAGVRVVAGGLPAEEVASAMEKCHFLNNAMSQNTAALGPLPPPATGVLSPPLVQPGALNV